MVSCEMPLITWPLVQPPASLAPNNSKTPPVNACSMRLGDVVLPHMRALAEATGEAVSFYIRERDVRVCLHQIGRAHV